MEESNKLSLKRVELPLSKFNEVAIPHHLDLLRQHRANIIKYESSGEWSRVRSEQAHARRVSARLRALLGEMEALRRQVRAQDLPAFDACTQRARDLTRRAVMDYLESAQQHSAAMEELQRSEADEEGERSRVTLSAAEVEQQLEEERARVREREAVLREWSALHAELRALHDVWQHVQAAALSQRETVEATATAVEVADCNVSAARAELSTAARLRGVAWCTGGVLLGAAAGGPLALVAGLKAGALAAAAGSLLGYCTARYVKPPPTADKDKDD